MSKMVVKAANTTVTIGGAEIGVKNLSFGVTHEEIQAYDTKSEDLLAGETSYPVSFTYTKDPDVAKLAENSTLTFSCAISDGTNTTTYAGNIKIMDQQITIDEGGEPTISATGKFTAAFTETIAP